MYANARPTEAGWERAISARMLSSQSLFGRFRWRPVVINNPEARSSIVWFFIAIITAAITAS
jgi:hypothetical protein